jgi:hypothetical protein
VLVDAYDLDHPKTNQRLQIAAGMSNGITVPVAMNTGEDCDTFTVTVESLHLPAGWKAAPGTRVLCAGEQAPVVVYLKPLFNAPPGIVSVADQPPKHAFARAVQGGASIVQGRGRTVVA